MVLLYIGIILLHFFFQFDIWSHCGPDTMCFKLSLNWSTIHFLLRCQFTYYLHFCNAFLLFISMVNFYLLVSDSDQWLPTWKAIPHVFGPKICAAFFFSISKTCIVFIFNFLQRFIHYFSGWPCLCHVA